MEITNIKTDNLFHHPDNPRVQYDVDDLIESVKENGITQPLIVVKLSKNIDRYNVVAGNRRLEAAKAGGLKECPCIISDMDDKEQAALMLIENMQRKNLTPYEEGKGVQMCLDLGMSEADIAKKTGFSKETIRHRKKLSELDQGKLKKKCSDGQISMQDLIKLEQITDPMEKNKVLDKIGTADFAYSIASAVREQEWKIKIKEIRLKLETFAEEMPEHWGDSEYEIIMWRVPVNFKIPEDSDTREYCFVHENPGKSYESFALYGKIEEDEDSGDDIEENKPAERSEWKIRNERRNRLKEENDIFRDIRRKFVKDHSGMDGDDLLQWLAYFAFSEQLEGMDEEDLEKTTLPFPFKEEINKIYFRAGADFGELYEGDPFEILRLDGRKLHKAMTLMIYAQLENETPHIMHADCDYRYEADDPKTELLYDFMDQLGYVPSEAEDKMMDGTHELYKED